MKTKKWYAEQVLRELQNDERNIDFKIDPREVFVRLDSIVNALARESYFENWKLSGTGVDEQYITTWDGDSAIIVVDQTDGKPSYFEFPVNYADLPRNRGIDEIWPQKYSKNNHPVVIMTHRDVRLYSNNMAGNLQGRLGGYVQGNRFYFSNPDNGCKVKAKYGNMGLRLVVRDSSQIANDQPYPIPADKEDRIVEMLVQWFRERRDQPTDKVRDSNDTAE